MFFRKKKDKYVLRLQIGFNLYEIANWLNSDLTEIPAVSYVKWDSPTIQKYTIFVLPIGVNTDCYYHKNINEFSHSVSALYNLRGGNHPQINLEKFCERHKVEWLEWEFWGGSLAIAADRKLIMLAPLDEAIPLQGNGYTSYTSRGRNETELIDVPTSFNDEGIPEGHIEIHKSIDNRGVIYSNQIVYFSIDVPRGPVGYGDY